MKASNFDQPIQKKMATLYSRQFFILWIANFFVVMSLGSFFLFPLFITQNGGSKSDIGILMGAMMLSSVLFRPWVSQMVDHFGRKRIFSLGTLILIGVPAAHILFEGDISGYYSLLVVARIVHGIGISIGFTAAYTFISDIVPDSRLNEGLGIFGLNGLIGIAVGPAISEPIINHFGFDAFFLTAASMAFISLILQQFLRETFVLKTSGNKSVSFFSVLRRRKTLGVGMVSIFFGMGLATQSGFISPYVQSLGLPTISIFFLSYSGGAILTRVFGAKIADRIGEETIVPWAIGINAIGYLILLIVNSSGMLLVAGLVTGAGHGFLFPCLNALAIRNEPAHIRGKISGIFTGSIDAGNLLGSLLLGYIGDWFGYRPLFFTTFLILMIGLLSFMGFLKKAILRTDR